MTLRACVVVPVFNHGIGAVALVQILARYNLPVLIINDGSEIPVQIALHALAEQHDWVQVLDHAENRGKGAAVLTGLRAAHEQGFSHALQIDADGQHNTDDIGAFLEKAEANPTAVIAGYPEFDSSVPKGRLIARYITHVWVWIETLSFTIRDSMCGFRIYPLTAVVRISDSARLGNRMDFDPEILVRLHWEGVPIVSLPTKVVYPVGGQSHFRLWHDNCLISWMHTRLVFGMIWRVVCFRLGRPSRVQSSEKTN